MNVIYRKKNYNIYRVGNGYIVHNINKPFKTGHTHISNYNTAKTILNFSFHKSVPHHLNKYLLQSIIRISTDISYIDKIRDLL